MTMASATVACCWDVGFGSVQFLGHDSPSRGRYVCMKLYVVSVVGYWSWVLFVLLGCFEFAFPSPWRLLLQRRSLGVSIALLRSYLYPVLQFDQWTNNIGQELGLRNFIPPYLDPSTAGSVVLNGVNYASGEEASLMLLVNSWLEESTWVRRLITMLTLEETLFQIWASPKRMTTPPDLFIEQVIAKYRVQLMRQLGRIRVEKSLL